MDLINIALKTKIFKSRGNMKALKALVFILIVFISSTNPLFSIIYGSLSGVVTDEETGKAVPEVSVQLNGRTNVIVLTDKNGKYLAKPLKPGLYTIYFHPSFPHCNVSAPKRIFIGEGENAVLNVRVKLGGSISGKVLYSDSKKPFPGVSIRAFARYAGSEYDTTKEDGSYFFGNMGRLCASPNYYIEADCNVPNVAYKVLLGVIVEKGIETKAEDILFDLNDPTGIEGYINSSIDGTPLNNVHITVFDMDKKYPGEIRNGDVEVGNVCTNSDGYYFIKNLDPGNYWIYTLPPLEDEWTNDEYSTYCKEETDIVVTSGKTTRIDSKLSIINTKNSSNGE